MVHVCSRAAAYLAAYSSIPLCLLSHHVSLAISQPAEIASASQHTPLLPEYWQNHHDVARDAIRSSDQERLYPANDLQRSGQSFLDEAVNALQTMQARFFELWIGTWPTCIDWTGAVVNTYVSALLGSLARHDNDSGRVKSTEIINEYFAHNIAYYFGEDAFGIRNEAFDDMLWVVLGWLESIKFINARNRTDALWHGSQFIPGFAHRARVFWDLASHGWDTKICDGGMIWNPRLTPYKNAITNQLFISASVSMYLYFPGDENTFPFISDATNSTFGRAHDPKYLDAAVKGYAWLKDSNMTNAQGLYVDGFHVTDWGVNGTIGTGKCDERNEIVYTYNQGVVLTGLRGLWEATGNQAYLQDGYHLIRNVMAATGWSEDASSRSPDWAGLGRNGVLEDICDSSGQCSQDSQTFKGIFFQHLTQFCMPLPVEPLLPGKTYHASPNLASTHGRQCSEISRWASYNARAALRSRNTRGQFGMWWGSSGVDNDITAPLPEGAQDYRNDVSLLSLSPWTSLEDLQPYDTQQSATTFAATDIRSRADGTNDVNDRGRGRTVETQGGGIAVLRAAWELSRRTTAKY